MKDKKIRKIVRVGNASAVTIPVDVMRKMDLKQGDHLRLDKITKVDVDVSEKSSQKKLKNDNQQK